MLGFFFLPFAAVTISAVVSLLFLSWSVINPVRVSKPWGLTRAQPGVEH